MATDVTIDHDDGWATLILDRPSKVNALTGSMFDAIGDAVVSFAGEGVDGVTIRGANGRFSAGVDMSDVPTWAEMNPLTARDKLEAIHDSLRALEALDAPVVAALEGPVLGGALELALACDIRIAHDGAEFGLPESELGLAMDLGGAQKLPLYVGEGLTKYLIMTGETIGATRAYEAGLIEEMHADGDFEAALADLESTLAGKPTHVHGLAKRQIHAARPDVKSGMQLAIHHAIAAYRETETRERVTDFFTE